MCGIIASIHTNGLETSVAPELYHALKLLKHRGQGEYDPRSILFLANCALDACGITTCTSQGKMYQCKGNGQATKVFHDGSRVAELRGYMGIAHLRYATSGTNSESEAQPMHVNSPCGLSFSHNGNLINVADLKRFLDSQSHQHVNKENDSKLMLNILAKELGGTATVCMNADDIRAALVKTYEKCLGGWACMAMVAGLIPVDINGLY